MTDQPPTTVVELTNYQGHPVLWSVVAVDKGDGKPSVVVSLQQGFLEDAPGVARQYVLGKSLRDVADRLVESAMRNHYEDQDEF